MLATIFAAAKLRKLLGIFGLGNLLERENSKFYRSTYVQNLKLILNLDRSKSNLNDIFTDIF